MKLYKKMLAEEYKDLNSVAMNYNKEYVQGNPTPNICFQNFFDVEFLNHVLEEFPDLESKNSEKMKSVNEFKFAGIADEFFGPKTTEFMNFLNSRTFLEFLQKLTGIEETLIGDPYFHGAGQHEIKKGGFLKVHADFNSHKTLKLDRRLNCLIYLNKNWKDEYGGEFELWDKKMEKCEKKIKPHFNTLAMFSTTDFSYHGHPDKLNCPDDMSRKSLALYYYSNGRPASEKNLISNKFQKDGTLFVQRKGDDKELGTINKKRSIKIILNKILPFIGKK